MSTQEPRELIPSDRLTALEELFSHLQHTTQLLSDEVVRQGRQLDALQRELKQLNDHLQVVAETLPERRRLEDEKPPHY